MKAKNIGYMVPSGNYRKHVCLNCGKEFTMGCETDQYRFKIVTNGTYKYFCKYSCKRAYEAARKPSRKSSVWQDFLT